jgi:hypothetical protein
VGLCVALIKEDLMYRIIMWGVMAIVYSFIPEAEFNNKTVLTCLCILMAFDRLLKENT